MSVTLRDEPTFERHVLAGLGGGLAAGLVNSGLEFVIGHHVPAMGALSFAALVGLAINLMDAREDTATVRLLLALIGGAGMALLMQASFWGAPLLGAALAGGFIGAGLTYNRPQPRWRFVAGIAVFAALLPAGFFTTETLFEGYFMQLALPGLVQDAITTTTWGLFLVLAAGLSDLRVVDDPWPAKLRAAILRHQDPVRDYLESARDLYQHAAREWARAEDPDTRRRTQEIAGEVVDSMLRFAERYEELRAALKTGGHERLHRRRQRLDRQLLQASTPEIAHELHQAREEVRAQLRLRERLELACVRLESKLQRGVTTLEKLHLTLTQHAASRVDDLALKDALANLEVFADEVHYQNLSIDELCDLQPFDELNAQVDQEVVFSTPDQQVFQAADSTDDEPVRAAENHAANAKTSR